MPEIQTLYDNADEFGPITVTDDGQCRILSFAANDEQSCCLKAAPHVLQFEYTQAMLLVLLFQQPRRVLVLGLGGGSLVSALHHCVPGVRITAVELRQSVIDLAYRYFQMPRGKRVQVVCGNADAYVCAEQAHKQDVVFADLYHSCGVDDVQLKADFIARCAAILKQDGWLVLNCWNEHREDAILRKALQACFSDIRTVLTSSRNWVILAGKTPSWHTNSEMKETAFQLSSALGFPLTRHLARMRAF
ncbi:MAG: methyltransferase domain-containing protein [Candidatus Thiothrix singaporensis]|uniref:Methyltransferase domain-containing protein n=1 Tax=Candidatus Thiothrix singaporensis TaxID=2799669 RepID=A0A7L6APZ4_9GAMM|nr:MAG: methyltransferase domain-containing protein [Candidatus Thiothrix singaporensis]